MVRPDLPRSLTAPPFHARRRRRSARPIVEGLEGRALLTTILALTNQDSLLTLNSASPSTPSANLSITGLPSGEKLVAIDFGAASEQLYGLGNKGHLYTINLASGAATPVSTTSFATSLIGSEFAMDENPVTDQIRIVDDAGQNFRVNPTTGLVALVDTALAYASGDPNAGKAPDVVGLSYTSNAAGATSTTAYALDATTGTLDLLGSVGGSPTSPNSGLLTTVGSLGVAVGNAPGDSFGFDVVGATTSAFAVLTPTSGTNSGKPVLDSINLATGAATAEGVVGDGTQTILGLAASSLAPPPAPTLAGTSETSPVKGSHLTNITTPTITGTALPGSTVWILANGNLVGSGTATTSGTYAITTAKLADGIYQIQAVQFDSSGLPSGPSPAMSPPLVIATATPAAPGVPSLFPADDTGFSDVDHFTNVNAPIFTGTAEPGATVFLFANYALVGSTTANIAGAYAVQSSPLADGAYLIQASQLDGAGNLSPASAAMSPVLVVDTSNRTTPQEAYIGALYIDLFGRPVDGTGLASWSAVLAGANGRNNVVAGLLSSTGFTGQVANVTYESLLGRAPTSAELTASEHLLATEKIEQFRAQIAGTAEFYTDSGSTIAGFLARLGQTTLGQPIDAASLATYTTQLEAGTSRTTVAYEVLTSTAGYTATASYLFATLQVSPTTSEVASAVSALQGGATDQQVLQYVATTDAFFASAQGNAETLIQWTNQVYSDLFGMAANPAGLVPLEGLLLTGAFTPLQAVQAFQSSPQYRQAEVTSAYETILGRAPDAPSLAAWSAYLAGSGTVEGMKAQLLGSAEFAVRFGGTTAGTLSAMYQIVVGQSPSPAVLSAMESQVAGGISVVQIASSLLYSPIGADTTVQTLYVTYLRRPATYAEMSTLAAELSVGQVTDQQIIAALVTSDQYFAGL